MAYSRRMVERARALRGAGLTVMEITEILGGPGKTSVWRWIRDVRKPAGRAGGGMDLPRLVGDGPDYPDIDPEDKDALIERLRLENAVLRAVQDVLKAESLDGMSNREKTLVIDRLRPCGKWSLRELTSSLGISKSSYVFFTTTKFRISRLISFGFHRFAKVPHPFFANCPIFPSSRLPRTFCSARRTQPADHDA